MMDRDTVRQALEVRASEQADRRAFFARALGAAAVGTAALATTRAAQAQTATPTPTPSASPTPTPSASPTPTVFDADYLNVALNLEYLQANFFSFATTGAAIAAADTAGTVGTLGTASGGRQITFADPLVAQYAREMAAEDLAHVRFLRAALGSLRAAQPAIDLSPGGAFSTAMRTAGVVPGGATFDPYANDDSFLLAAFLFKDLAVSAYKATAPLLVSATLLEAAAGLLGTEAYHAATVRTTLFRRSNATPSLIQATEQISQLRDTFDGTVAENLAIGVGPDSDQGIAPGVDAAGAAVSNIVPVNANGLVFSRTPAATLNILYLTRAAATSGGFFPAGLNGNLKTSAATG